MATGEKSGQHDVAQQLLTTAGTNSSAEGLSFVLLVYMRVTKTAR